MQGTWFLNWESVSVLTSNITSKKCGGKISHLQYEGCELCTLTTLSKIQQHYMRNVSIQSEPSYAAKPSWVVSWPSDIWVKQQYSGLIKALAKSYFWHNTESLQAVSHSGRHGFLVKRHSILRTRAWCLDHKQGHIILWLQRQICLKFPQIIVFDKPCLNRKASLKILILWSYIIHLSLLPPNTPKVYLVFSPQEYREWIFLSPVQIVYPRENCKTNLKIQNNLTFSHQ